MTRAQADAELARLAAKIEAGELKPASALEHAFALGVEWERLEMMHKACEQYSAARAESERRRRDTVPPPPHRVKT